MAITIQNQTYDPQGYITTKGDTIKKYISYTAKPGSLYSVKYTYKKDGNGIPVLTTQKELDSNSLSAGEEYKINLTSDWGKQLLKEFDPNKVEITTDYSKKPWYSKWFYRLTRYQEGGSLNYLNLFE